MPSKVLIMRIIISLFLFSIGSVALSMNPPASGQSSWYALWNNVGKLATNSWEKVQGAFRRNPEQAFFVRNEALKKLSDYVSKNKTALTTDEDKELYLMRAQQMLIQNSEKPTASPSEKLTP